MGKNEWEKHLRNYGSIKTGATTVPSCVGVFLLARRKTERTNTTVGSSDPKNKPSPVQVAPGVRVHTYNTHATSFEANRVAIMKHPERARRAWNDEHGAFSRDPRLGRAGATIFATTMCGRSSVLHTFPKHDSMRRPVWNSHPWWCWCPRRPAPVAP